jgi:hypothetical protein
MQAISRGYKNHENANDRAIGQGEVRRRKHKTLSLKGVKLTTFQLTRQPLLYQLYELVHDTLC